MWFKVHTHTKQQGKLQFCTSLYLYFILYSVHLYIYILYYILYIFIFIFYIIFCTSLYLYFLWTFNILNYVWFGIKCPGIRLCLIGWLMMLSASSSDWYPCWRMQQYPLQGLEPLTKGLIVTSLKVWILSDTAVRTSNLTFLLYLMNLQTV